MAYDVALAERIAGLLKGKPRIAQKQMFGGVCFLINGKMCCGVIGNKLVARVGPERYESALTRPHTKPMDFTGRPLRSFVYVLPRGVQSPATLKGWVDLTLRYAKSLPAKRTRKRALLRLPSAHLR